MTTFGLDGMGINGIRSFLWQMDVVGPIPHPKGQKHDGRQDLCCEMCGQPSDDRRHPRAKIVPVSHMDVPTFVYLCSDECCQRFDTFVGCQLPNILPSSQ